MIDSKHKIAITGGTGMIGTAVRESLERDGHEVAVISRSGKGSSIPWDLEAGVFDATPLDGFYAVIHLAGEPIAQRWTGEVRERIYASRIGSTKLLVDSLSKLENPPKVLLSASGINYYPSTSMSAGLDETAEAGDDFLSRVCLHWEEEANKARAFSARVCLLRTSVVLSPKGGALAKLLPVFKSGVGGRVGSGKQPFPWVSIADYVRICSHLLFGSSFSGPVNVVAPERADNRTFTRTLGEALGRPTIFPVPRAAIRLAFGEMGRSTLLEGVDAIPGVLQKESFSFSHPDLKSAFADLLGRG